MHRLPPHDPGPGGLMRAVTGWFQRLLDVESALPQHDEPGPADPTFTPNGALRVLVVDDNPVNLMVVSALLEQFGISALLASDGAEAVKRACETSFDIILMDIQMPVLDGLMATAEIRRVETMQSRPGTPVVAYSSLEVDGAALTASGMSGVLAKPCNAAELEACLAQWCVGFHLGAAGITAYNQMPAASSDGIRWSSRGPLPG